jgi:hypothetical protein
LVSAGAVAAAALCCVPSDASAQDPLAGTDNVTRYCGGPAGWLVFHDRPFFEYKGGCGKVFGDNNHWGLLAGGWDNRADNFMNNGTWFACLHDLPGWGGRVETVLPGFGYFWPDGVSANRWIQGLCR